MTGDHQQQRREYEEGQLRRSQLSEDPLVLFGTWLDEALSAGAKDATAMALATATPDGVPSVRIVLLKEHGPEGFVWYTDQDSPKGAELAANPVASLAFYWRDFNRQVRLSGFVSKVDEATACAYFDARPEESRFSAAASTQSSPVADRRMLEDRVAALRTRYPDGRVPKPGHWGGYRLIPERIEFWQGRTGRLHDRFLYTRTGSGWHIQRLAP